MPTKRKAKKTRKIIGCTHGKRHKNSTSFLHEEVIFNILSWLPAKYLHGIMRYVCNTWAHIICNPYFVETQLQRSKPGLVLQNQETSYALSFLEFKEDEGFHVTRLVRHIPGLIVGGCDGVLIFTMKMITSSSCKALPRCICRRTCFLDTIFVSNPTTMAVTKLPVFVPDESIELPSYIWHGIAHVPDSGEFKLVCGHFHPTKGACWFILRVGIDDSWREMGSVFSKLSRSLLVPTSVGQFVYWTPKTLAVLYHEVIVTDIVNESVYSMSVPEELGLLKGLVKIGDCLASITCSSPFNCYSFYLLKDVRLGKWECYHRFHFYSPIAWDLLWIVADFIGCAGHYLIMHVRARHGSRRILITYNMQTYRIRHFDSAVLRNMHSLHMHTDSLVSW